MAKHYFLNAEMTASLVSNGLLAPPADWDEVTVEEYDEWNTSQREIAAQRAAEWWAGHGAA